MKHIIMQARCLIVLCLINISVQCKPKIDKNGNPIPNRDNGQNRIETPNTEANFPGGSGRLDLQQNLVDIENNVITNYPYKGDEGVMSNFYEDIILPQGEIHFQPYKQGSEYNIHNLPSSSYNTGAVDNGRVLKYNKGNAYRTDGYSASESYSVGRSGPTNNYHDLNNEVYDQFPSYNKIKFNGNETGIAAPWYYDKNGNLKHFLSSTLRTSNNNIKLNGDETRLAAPWYYDKDLTLNPFRSNTLRTSNNNIKLNGDETSLAAPWYYDKDLTLNPFRSSTLRTSNNNIKLNGDETGLAAPWYYDKDLTLNPFRSSTLRTSNNNIKLNEDETGLAAPWYYDKDLTLNPFRSSTLRTSNNNIKLNGDETGLAAPWYYDEMAN